jgi:predicted DNA binding CopG/RHH family protein
MSRQKRPKQIPEFVAEERERAFWETHDTSDYLDWSRAVLAEFPNLKPSTQTISLRLPSSLLAELKILANQRDVPYQSLLKVFLAERVARERAARTAIDGSNRRRARRRSTKKSRRRGSPVGRSID